MGSSLASACLLLPRVACVPVRGGSVVGRLSAPAPRVVSPFGGVPIPCAMSLLGTGLFGGLSSDDFVDELQNSVGLALCGARVAGRRPEAGRGGHICDRQNDRRNINL